MKSIIVIIQIIGEL